MSFEGSAPSSALWRVLSYLALSATIAGALVIGGGSAPATPGPETPATSGMTRFQTDFGLRTIVIDPGHGGQSIGAVGPGGVTEKDVTLDIAVRLRELIFRRIGLQVFLTREADVDVPLDTRTEKANNLDADLFISIHANSYRLNEVRGPETYFLSASASDRLAQEIARTENREPTGQPESPQPSDTVQADPSLDFILWDLAQTQHLRASSLLATSIQSDLSAVWRLRDRGVKQAPFRVLTGATMPAILVEVGYLSNDHDASRLADPFFRQQVAEALLSSLNSFREQYAVMAGAVPND